MDDRQHAFLARQPSAALQTREHFWGMPKRGLAFLLANVMFWQPLWAQAEGIVVSAPGTGLDRAGNGVPIVNIAKPNGNGLSHNQFKDYNVGSNGVILNNATARTQSTQLGGIILGNSNLNGAAAKTILNEVNGGNPSQLRGYTEVAGQSAHVIVANPYGISCNGCGFINSPKVTLSTGKPVVENGRLDRYQVDKGSVAIEGAGLNANNVDHFEIITRSAKINAEIQAKNLTIVAGRNDVNATTLNATARAEDGSAKPQLAIDSSALGGMYAGAIKLVGTEAGVGVKLDGKLIASGGDIQLDANGHLSLVDTSATGAVKVKAASLDARGPVYAGTTLNAQTQGNLTNQKTLAARNTITLGAGGQLSNNGIIEAGVNADNSRNAAGDVSLTAQNLSNNGKSVIASRNLTANVTKTLNNQGGTLSAGQTGTVKAGTLDNQNKGRVLSSGALSVTVSQVFNTNGVINSTGNLTGAIGQLNNSNGEISSAGITRLNGTALNNRSGQILGDLGLSIDLSGALDNRDGLLGSGKNVDLRAASLDNRDAGVVVSDGTLTTRISGLLDNQNKGEIVAKGAMDVRSASFDNRGGKISGKDTLTVTGHSTDNRGGVIQADKHLKLQVGQLDNRDKGLISGKTGIAYEGTRLDNAGGLLSAVGPVTLNADEVQNAAGRISSQNDLTATIGLLQQQGGELVAQGNLKLTGTTLDNRNGGLIGTTKALTLKVEDIDNRAGELSSSLLLDIDGQRLDNSEAGKILAATDLEVAVAKLINQNKGLIVAQGSTVLSGATLDNSGGSLNSLKGLDITLDDALLNTQGLINSEGALTVNAQSLDNTGATLGSAGALSVTSRGALLNRGGSISTDSTLMVDSVSLDNSQKGLISGKDTTTVTTGDMNNSQGGRFISGTTLDLTAKQVNNAAGRIASQKALTASVTGLDQQGGELFSQTSLSLDLNNGQLNNQGGLINAPLLMLKNLSGVNNQSGEISSQQAFKVTASDLNNNGGKLLSNQGLTLRITQALDNIKGVISAASLDSRSANLNNNEGLISSFDRLELRTDKALDNQSGTVVADGELLLVAETLNNRTGEIAGKADAIVQVASLDNSKGQLITTGTLQVTADTLDNRLNGLLGASQAMTLTVDDVDNRGGELTTNSDLSIIGKKFDNRDGGKAFAGQAMKLTIDQLLNGNRGLLSATTTLNVEGRSLDNTGGNLLSVQGIHLDLTDAFDNSQGQVSSEGTLTVETGELINTQGSLSSAADLKLTSDTRINNQGGNLITDGALTLNSASLDNRQSGSISGKGAVTVTTGAFDNSQGGRVTSAATLDLIAGQVTNQEDGRIGSQGALTASVTGLDQQGGKLFSNTRLSLDMHNGQLNNQGGLINTPGALLLKQLNGINNQGGEISSAQAFTLTAQNLDNSGGKLLSNQALTLRITNVMNNLKGQIGAAALDVRAASLNNSGGSLVSRGNLELTSDGLLRNDTQGLISAAQTLTLTSGDFNNQGGTVLGVDAVTLDTQALNNREGGLINSQGNLTLTGTQLDSSNDGEVSAKGDINLTLAGLTQQAGRLLGDKAVTVDLANGDFDNSNGLLTAKGPLTFNRLRDLNNQKGEISSSQGFNVIGRALNNSSGKLISSQQLGVAGTTLINQKGLISGWQGLTVEGDSLDNRDNGTLSSRSGDVAVDLKEALLNSNAGALASQGKLSVKSKSLDNSNKGILSSGAGQTLELEGELKNGQGGLIDSSAGLDITATGLTNVGGAVNAQQSINADMNSLDNRAGQIVGNAALTLSLLGSLNNNDGKLAGAGPMLIKGVTDLSNQKGQLAGQSTLTLLTQTLDNSLGGTVAANDALLVTASGAVRNNANGLIYSQKADVQVQAGSLLNGKGTIQGENGLTLDISGDFDNQSGKVIAQSGTTFVKAANIDNRGGILSSIAGALEARTVGVLRNGYDLNNSNQRGIIQGQALKLTALAGLNNIGGWISAQGSDASVTSAAFENREGALYAKGLAGVIGTSLNNASGQIAGDTVNLSLTGALNNRAGIIESDTQLTTKAISLDNQAGQLRSLGNTGKTSFQIGGLLDNRNGVLETANTDLTLAVGSFLNGGGQLNHVGLGTFDISTANVMGAGGGITTGGTLALNADTWTNSSVIQAGRLNVNVNNFTQTASGQLLATRHLQGRGTNWINNGLIASDASLDLQLGGSYGGNGRVSSLGDLYLSAAQLNLNAASSIAGGGATTVKVGGQLSNAGRLTSNGGLTVEAGSLNNTGTLGSAQSLRVKTPSLMNDHGLIFSGDDTALEVGSVTNSYGDFYSLGDLIVKGYNGAARANVLENISGVMESAGDMSINATTLNNRGEKFEVARKLISSFIAVHCNDCSGDTYYVDYGLREIYEGSVVDQSPTAKLTAGGNFTFNGGDFLNSRSEVTAARNITIAANNFSNIGAASGTIERTRIFSAPGITDGTHNRFALGAMWEFNKRNDNGPLTFHYIDDVGQFRTTDYAMERYYQKGSEEERMILVDSVTRRKLDRYGAWHKPERYETSEYDPDNLLPLPAQLTRFNVSSDVEVSRDGGSVQSAIVQAGGKVSINAAQNLSNSVVHEDYAFSAGVDRRQNTLGGGTGKPLLVHLNSQLPPDLSKQQVNPLSLPGFVLPTGQNGLFRLSDQGATTKSISLAPTGSQGWSLSSANVDALQRTTVVADGPRTLSVNGPAAVSDSQRAVLPVKRVPLQAMENASAFDASVLSAATGAGLSIDIKATSLKQPVNRVTGLPDTKTPSNAHKYLIETNPVLTNLNQFMSSDYLLKNLGYDPDTAAKRLGDGLYEQRLVQQAVVARTGQRFIDGQTSDEAMFKYLMNNAIASKDQLNLAVGVTLTAQQVAALTHDIVWLEEHEVNGEKVLVPVLYMANANNRLAANGALIQGTDVTLIAGKDLTNSGTLRASNNLSATAGNDLVNSGLVEAGNRLDLLAGNNLVNKAGGIIAGRDVNLVAVSGDVINERTATTLDSRYSSTTLHRDYVDSAARIEAANDLTISAGRDAVNAGGVMKSGGDTYIDATRDISALAVQERDSGSQSRFRNETITQHSASIEAGRDLTLKSGRDIAVVASDIAAKRDVSMTAAGNLLLSSAADESHSYSRIRKTTRQQDKVTQVAATVEAGGDVSLSAGGDMALVSSRITARDEAYLVAAGKVELLAAQNSSYSLYDMKKKGSWGSKKTQRDEVTHVTNIGTQISTGGDLTVLSGGDQRYQVAKLESAQDINLTSGGAITFEGVKDLHQESHQKSRNSMTWNSAKGRGNTDETLRQSQLIAQGDLVINAVNGLNIDIKKINQNTVSQTIDAMVKADPQLAWLKEAEARGDVDWQLIKETHESFKYSSSGMGPAAMLAVIIIVTVLTAGTASAAVGTAASATAGSGTAMAASGIASGAALTGGAAVGSTVGAGLGNIMASAVLTSMASGAAVSAINNQGNVGAVFKDVFSSESLKGYVLAGASAGIASQFGFSATDLKFDLASAQSVAIKVAADAAAKTAIMGGSLKDNLVASALGSAISIGGAVSANKIGDITVFDDGKLSKVVMHAALGGLMAEAMGGDFRTGAIAAGANEALVDALADKLLPVGVDRNSLEYQQGVTKLLAASQLIGVLTAAFTGGDASAAAAVTANATQYNNLDHPSAERLLKELQGCRTTGGCSAANIREIVGRYEELSAQRSMAINACESRACVEGIQKSAVSLEAPVAKDLLDFLRRNVSYDMAGLLTGNPGAVAVPSQGVDGWGALFTSDKQMAFAKNLKEGWLTPSELAGVDQWVKETSWLDQQAGRQLSLNERATLLTELKITLGMAILGKSSVGSAGNGGTKGIIKASETIGQPVEAVIGGRKRLLRVDIEPNGKLQIQSGGGKDSIVDFRPDLSKPLAPQINTAFKRLPQSARDQLVKNAEKGLKRLQETGNM
ncbi:filamentous hemagglutinin N-terminal domain-containing protein [Pseudomonas sp. NFACC45]|uniref:two-partner secretion domain-containing protein n=1 Tax=Pseudomonas sp. NFACC45 TaxID=1566201 RepID=UPI0008EA7C89|nr:filamentous hemagglutinin N-terminal domain-containing protein [Pseudomonas sp. NFACC45]SFH27432.1 filamentous hemagglutinin [Pseudomonas sp. NFACC45]